MTHPRIHAALLSLVVCPLSLVCGFSGGVVVAQTRAGGLVPAQFNYKTDALGFRWDMHSYGYINNGHNNTFGNAAVLTVNNNSFRPRTAMMTPNGNEYVLTGQIGNLPVTRRVKFDLKNSAVQFVDIIVNNTAAAINVNVRLQSTMGRGPLQAVVAESGTPLSGNAGAATPFGSPFRGGNQMLALGKKDGGFLGFSNPQNGGLSVLFDLASPRSKVKPQIMTQSNYQLTFTYNLPIPPNKSAAVMHGIAQRSLAAVPDAKGIQSLFKPFRSRSWTKGLPAKIRKTIVNSGGMQFDGWAAANALASIEALGVERGAFDILAVSSKTRLRGSATCASVLLKTKYGDLKTTWDDMAAIIGGAGPTGQQSLLLRDGRVFHGDMTLTDLVFTMSSGVTVDIAAEQLDRLVTRASPRDGQPPAGVFALLETTEGERFALSRNDDHKLNLITPWGERALSWDDIVRLESVPDQPGLRVGLQDGSRLYAYLSSDKVTVNTLAFGSQSFASNEIKSVIPALRAGGESDEGELTTPHAVLAGGNLIMGQIDQSHIHFLLSGQAIPVPTNQIRQLRNTTENVNGPPAGPAAAFFHAELWDGGTLAGRLSERVLPIRNGEQVYQVRARDVVEIHRPTPTVSESLRRTIAQRIRELGSDEYETREAASRAISELGYLAKQQLSEAVGQTTDPEVRRRVEQILAELTD